MADIRRGPDGEILAFRCRSCETWHVGPIESLGADAPGFVQAMSNEEREDKVTLTPDQCIVDYGERADFLVRGCLEIPVLDGPTPFTFGVWVSLSEANFQRSEELWEKEGREREKPYFGWLCTQLPGYPDTLLLKTWVQTRPRGERPAVTVFEPEDHPLTIEQQAGVTTARIVEILEAALH